MWELTELVYIAQDTETEINGKWVPTVYKKYHFLAVFITCIDNVLSTRYLERNKI